MNSPLLLCAVACALLLPVSHSKATAGSALPPAIKTEDLPPVPDDVEKRDEMRRLVLALSRAVKAAYPKFVVLAGGGLSLATKTGQPDGPADEEYLKAVDGVLIEDVFLGGGGAGVDSPTVSRFRDEAEPFIKLFRAHKRPMLAADHGQTPARMDTAYAAAARQGFVAYIGPAGFAGLARYPVRPVAETAGSILSLNEARNFALIQDSGPMGSRHDYLRKLAQTNHDVLIIDAFHQGKPLSRDEVHELKFKKTGARRLVLALLNVGSAETWRYYWKTKWVQAPPSWIGKPRPGRQGEFLVAVADPAWHALTYNGRDSWLGGIIQLGFDGVLLQNLDAYRPVFFAASTVREPVPPFAVPPAADPPAQNPPADRVPTPPAPK